MGSVPIPIKIKFQQQTISHSEAHVITVDQGTLKEDFKFVPPLLAVLVALVFHSL